MRSLSRPTQHALLLGIVLSLGSLGCASGHDLTLTSLERHQTFRQGFTQAYSSRNASGDTDIVLIDSAAEQGLSGQAAQSPVSQVMHIRLLWSVSREMKAVTSNSSLKWYVICRSEPPAVLEYSGVAFVSSSNNDDGMKLKVTNGALSLASKHGNMVDWIGASSLEGNLTAREDHAMVEKILGQLNATVAAASKPPTDIAGREHALAQ